MQPTERLLVMQFQTGIFLSLEQWSIISILT